MLEDHSSLRITPVKELEKASYAVRWQPFVQPDLAFINKHAYFDYQRQRVFLRANKELRHRHRAVERNRNGTVRASQQVQLTASRCPKCRSADLVPIVKRSHRMGTSSKRKRAFDLRITETGIRRWVIDCRATMYHCRACGYYFVPHQHNRLARHFHGYMSWIIYLQVAHALSTGSIQRMFYDLFALKLSGSDIMMIRTLMARYYRPTYNRLVRTLVNGSLLHADETEVRLRTGKGYVWVFTSAEEVAYMYRPSRGGEFLSRMLEGFRGVLGPVFS
jgi:Transposase IS66 family